MSPHRRKKDKFLRVSNVQRIIGGLIIGVGQMLPKTHVDLKGFVFDSNILQMAGVVLLFSPMIMELFRIVFLKTPPEAQE